MKTLTVFTPSYNRRHTLPRTYESLCRQTCKDFEWLIIDDGSKDDTQSLVEEWQKDAIVPIKYIYKENGGLHTGYNVALANINTELNVCIDSDDYMPDNAVEKILEIWNNRDKSDDSIAGIIGLDFYDGGDAIGGFLPDNAIRGHITDLEMKYHHRGDMKIVCRTDLIRKFVPMPVFAGERNFNPIYLYLQVDNDHEFLYTNDNFCFVDYQPTGMAANILHQYYNSPRSFAALRELNMSQRRLPFALRFRNAIHFVSSLLIAKDFQQFCQSKHKAMAIAAIPFGIILFCYINWKNRK